MYEAYFGLKENPFTLAPDPRYLYLSPQHREALNCLIYGIGERKGFMVVTGGIGTGKTTLCRSFLAGLDGATASALIFNPALSEIELLKTITQEFGIRLSGRGTKKRYLDALNGFLLENFAAGKNAVLMIDEAQNLSHGVLEQIRMLSNLETDREKLIQIVLWGQPELRRLLALPSLRQLNERITVRYELKPLVRDDVRRYVEHRLATAGVEAKAKSCSFTVGSYDLIHRLSGGVPRRINAICDRALLIAYGSDLRTIDGRLVRTAVRDIGPDYPTAIPARRRTLWIGFAALATAVLLLAVLALGNANLLDGIGR
ncbi:MAG: AAA family ATPase [Deltaproteobacteria bacterium]|nr:AAA family ATPase [Deltaproteobacteria bacterium]